MKRIGIDLGGTKIEGVVLDESGEYLARHRVPTPKHSYEVILNTLVDLVARLESETGRADSIGIGTPGCISMKTGLMKNSNTVVLNGEPVKDDLESLFGRPISMANDANCFALSEAVDGAGKDGHVVFGVIVGTGTGAGVVVDRQVLTGPNSVAGEWGHNPLPWPQDMELPGPECYCGKHGCIETWLSGPGMIRDHELHANIILDPATIVSKATFGDEECEETLQRYEDRMARALASIINTLDPDIIVLGGGVGNIKRLYSNVPKLWGQYVFSDSVETRLVAPMYGDSSGVRGAAWL